MRGGGGGWEIIFLLSNFIFYIYGVLLSCHRESDVDFQFGGFQDNREK